MTKIETIIYDICRKIEKNFGIIPYFKYDENDNPIILVTDSRLYYSEKFYDFRHSVYEKLEESVQLYIVNLSEELAVSCNYKKYVKNLNNSMIEYHSFVPANHFDYSFNLTFSAIDSLKTHEEAMKRAMQPFNWESSSINAFSNFNLNFQDHLRLPDMESINLQSLHNSLLSEFLRYYEFPEVFTSNETREPDTIDKIDEKNIAKVLNLSIKKFDLFMETVTSEQMSAA